MGGPAYVPSWEAFLRSKSPAAEARTASLRMLGRSSEGAQPCVIPSATWNSAEPLTLLDERWR
jgi:hypothetical protein